MFEVGRNRSGLQDIASRAWLNKPSNNVDARCISFGQILALCSTNNCETMVFVSNLNLEGCFLPPIITTFGAMHCTMILALGKLRHFAKYLEICKIMLQVLDVSSQPIPYIYVPSFLPMLALQSINVCIWQRGQSVKHCHLGGALAAKVLVYFVYGFRLPFPRASLKPHNDRCMQSIWNNKPHQKLFKKKFIFQFAKQHGNEKLLSKHKKLLAYPNCFAKCLQAAHLKQRSCQCLHR